MVGRTAAIAGIVGALALGTTAFVVGGSDEDEVAEATIASSAPATTDDTDDDVDASNDDDEVTTTTVRVRTTTDDSDDASNDDDDADEVIQAAMDELEEELTIRRSDLMHPEVRTVAECQSDEFLYNSLAGVELGNPLKRQYTDAVTIPYTTIEVEGMMIETRNETCQNIVFWDMVLRGFGQDTLVVNGKTLRALNPWIDECLESAGNNQERFADLDSLLRVEEVDEERKLHVREETQECAMLVNALLSKAQVIGNLPDLLTSENWHLPGVTEGAIPRVALNANQYTGNFLVLEFTAKGYGCVERFGFNTGTPDNPLGDKRFARFVCETPPPVETVPPVVEVVVTTTTNPTTRTTPTTTTVPTGTVTTTVTTTTAPTVPTTTTTTVPCGNKNRFDPATGQCVPNLPTSGTVAPPPVVPSSSTTAPTFPPTAPPDTLPPGVTPTTVNWVPPDNPDSGDGAVSTTVTPTTSAPPTNSTLPSGGGSTPTPP